MQKIMTEKDYQAAKARLEKLDDELLEKREAIGDDEHLTEEDKEEALEGLDNEISELENAIGRWETRGGVKVTTVPQKS